MALGTAATLLMAPVASASVSVPAAVDDVPVATVVDDATYAKIRAGAIDVPGESDAGASGFSEVVAKAAAAAPPNVSLPYDSTYSVQYSLQSGKRWQTASGRACVYIRSSRNGVGITVSIVNDGGFSYGKASFPQDGVTRNYCFGGLQKSSTVYHLFIVKPAQQDFPATGNVTVTA